VSSNKKLFFCNVDFDTDLASGRSLRQQRSCLEAQFYYLLCGTADDAIILDASPHESYSSYLAEQGIDLPRHCSEGETLPGYTAFPWGWSAPAVGRFLDYGAKVHYPRLECIQAVNSRRFCHRVTRKHGLGIPGSKICESAEEIRSCIRASRLFPLVVKPEHGNAGIGLIHLPSADRADRAQTVRIDSLFRRPGATAVVEPWVDRVADISTRFQLDNDGRTASIVHHRTLNNRGGVYFGNLLVPEDTLIEKWRQRLDAGAITVSRELHSAGYFGPAGLDWIIYEEGETGEETCAIVDINARQPMSFVAYSLRERLAENRHCLFLFAPRRNYPALTDYGSWQRGCGDHVFNVERAAGILLFTPLSYTAERTEYGLLRHGFFIAGNTREEMLGHEGYLRRAFRKN